MFNIFFSSLQTLQTYLRVIVEVELLVHLNNITVKGRYVEIFNDDFIQISL